MKKTLNIKPIEASGIPGLPSFDAEVEGLPEVEGTIVVANPEMIGDELDLKSIQIGNDKFNIPGGATPIASLKLYDHNMQNDSYELHIISATPTEYETASAALNDATVIAFSIVVKATSAEGLFLRSATQGHFNLVTFSSEGAATVTDVDGASFELDHVTEIVNPVAVLKKTKK